MRIAQLAPLAEAVPPLGYGGIELVVNLVTEELVKRGHEVTLFASGDSKTKANLVSVVPKSLRTDENIPIRRWSAYDIRNILELQVRRNEFDIVHNHIGWQALPFLQKMGLPSLTTNHNRVKKYCEPIYTACKELPYVAISKSYRELNYPQILNYVATIYNGIETQDYDFVPQTKGEYLLFIGRVCHDKGAAEAIDIAQSLDLPLIIAGKVDPADEKYWQELIKPRVDGHKVKYVGEVNFKEKNQLFGQAKAVLYPITFDEPFGLVMAESLACGTPVAALNRGSVKEVVADGETGIVCDSKEEIIERFKEIEQIDRAECRRRAINLFSKESMVDGYEAVYNTLCK